jgi:hypothetical protein
MLLAALSVNNAKLETNHVWTDEQVLTCSAVHRNGSQELNDVNEPQKYYLELKKSDPKDTGLLFHLCKFKHIKLNLWWQMICIASRRLEIAWEGVQENILGW